MGLAAHEFGGVKLCERCRDVWRQFSETLPKRTAEAFPELLLLGVRMV
jgi:hypothetical protein